ncbi:hypothetical protein ACRRTK_009612 [Alexandromys fortis]
MSCFYSMIRSDTSTPFLFHPYLYLKLVGYGPPPSILPFECAKYFVSKFTA